ncbi:MAG TPA: hypothetical protein VD866_28580 [Urbifossiella sp.]|nr:hypothetical protein [Urbifossiella sp.]
MNGCGFQVPDATWEEVCRLAARLGADPGYPYPWEGLEAALGRAGRRLPLIGYGSLMDPGSAARTIRPGAERRAVVAFGARRVFNYAMPYAVLTRLGWATDTSARAALNVYPTGNPADVLNGVRIEIPEADIPALRAREQGYDLRPLACLDWDEPAGRPAVGYVLCAPDNPPDGSQRTDDALTPQPDYARLCRDGAAGFGAAFEAFYLATTWLADRRTTAASWEAAGGL